MATKAKAKAKAEVEPHWIAVCYNSPAREFGFRESDGKLTDKTLQQLQALADALNVELCEAAARCVTQHLAALQARRDA